MWKYIIAWCIVNVVTDPCPERDKVDEFGRVSSVGAISCGVHHFHIEYDCGHSKLFFDADSARSFYDRAKEQGREEYTYLFGGGLEDVSIDSVWIPLKGYGEGL